MSLLPTKGRCPRCGHDHSAANEFAPQQLERSADPAGRWTLTAPDGSKFVGASPLHVAHAAVDEPGAYALVPRALTEDMHAAAVRTIVRCQGNDDFPPRVWQALLAISDEASRTASDPETEVVRLLPDGRVDVSSCRFVAADPNNKRPWIRWRGGDRPVAGSDVVEYQMRDGGEFANSAGGLYWDHRDRPNDIVAYHRR